MEGTQAPQQILVLPTDNAAVRSSNAESAKAEESETVRHTDFMTTHSNSPKLHSPKQNPSTGEPHGSVGSSATAPRSW